MSTAPARAGRTGVATVAVHQDTSGRGRSRPLPWVDDTYTTVSVVFSYPIQMVSKNKTSGLDTKEKEDSNAGVSHDDASGNHSGEANDVGAVGGAASCGLGGKGPF